MRIAVSSETLMRQPGSMFKISAGASGRWAKLARAAAAAMALSACSTLQGQHEADVKGDSQAPIVWSTPGTPDLQTEIARLKAENAKLTTKVAELQKQLAAPAPASDSAAAAPGGETEAAAEEGKLEVPAAPLKPETVVASADVDRALANSPAPPVDPAPRLVQPSFASDQETVFENEAADSIKTSSVLYGVHLASYRRVEDARAGWRKLQRENPDELGLLEPRVENITIPGRGDFIRLIGGGFSSREKAEELCERLRARHLYCTVRDFDGQRLSMAG